MRNRQFDHQRVLKRFDLNWDNLNAKYYREERDLAVAAVLAMAGKESQMELLHFSLEIPK